jgi:hypothetical protein
MTMSSDERKKAAEDFEELEPEEQQKFLSQARDHFPEENVEQREGETRAQYYLRQQEADKAREQALPLAAVELHHNSLKPTPHTQGVDTWSKLGVALPISGI